MSATATAETSVVIAIPDDSEIRERQAPVVTRARAIVIATPEDYSAAGEFLKLVKAKRNEVQEFWSEPVDAANKAHKALTSRRNAMDAPLATAEAEVKAKMSQWFTEQERKRREEEARLQREAEQRERERVAAERARLDEERRLREQQALEEAARLESSGRKAEADAVVEAALSTPPEPEPTYIPPAPVFLAPVAPKVQGVSTRKTWKHRVVDFTKLPDRYKLANDSVIAQQVRSLGQQHGIPGVEAYEEFGIAGSGR